MNHIKSIKESINNTKIYAVIVERTNDTDFFRSMYIDNTVYFSNELNAADYLIKYINKYFPPPTKKFEPMKEDDGTRLFITVKDNPDFKKALTYMKNYYKKEKIYIKEVKLSDSTYLSEFNPVK